MTASYTRWRHRYYKDLTDTPGTHFYEKDGVFYIWTCTGEMRPTQLDKTHLHDWTADYPHAYTLPPGL